MGYHYWLEVNKNGNEYSFKVSCDEEAVDEKVIKYEVKHDNDDADIFEDVYMLLRLENIIRASTSMKKRLRNLKKYFLD